MIAADFTVLVNRERHQKFHVKDGKLEVITSIYDKIKYLFFRHSIQAEVKGRIKELVKHLEISHIDKLAHLSLNVFDRSAISEEMEEEFIGKVEGIYERAVAKVRLAHRLGLDFEINGTGCSGSYMGKDIRGNTLIIFKPEDESPESGNSPKLRSRITYYLKKICFFKQHENLYPEQSSRNEVRAYQLSKQLGLHVVPETRMETFTSKMFMGKIKEKQGSCQLWVPNVTSSKEIEAKELQKLVMIDFLMGGQDRHEQNWLLTEEGEIVVIDNGSSFPHHFFTTEKTKKYMYDWRNFEAAKEPLENRSFTILYEELELDRDQEALMKRREAILKKAMSEKKPMSYLGQIRDEKEFLQAESDLNSVSSKGSKGRHE